MPPWLHPPDVVRVVAPSGAFDQQRFRDGLAWLTERGLTPHVDERIFSRHRYLAGDDDLRLTLLQEALQDPNAKAIWMARGGYGATRLLPRLAVQQVGQANKWLIGFSDTTALHGLWGRAGLASLHGANVTTLPTWKPTALEALWSWLCGPHTDTFAGEELVLGPAVSGVLAGGNLTVLAAMAGTGYLPSFAQKIVLLEDVGERPYRLDRSLTQLIQAGAFTGVRGVAIGQLTQCDAPDHTPLEVLAEVLRPLQVPVLCGVEIGHAAQSQAVVLGAMARLDVRRGLLQVSTAEG